MHQLDSGCARTRGVFHSILPGREFQVPGLEELLLRVLADALTAIGFELHLPVVTDVGEVGGNGTDAASAACDFYHDLRGASDRASDLLDLGESQSLGRTSPGRAQDVEERPVVGGCSENTASHERASQAMRAALVRSTMRFSRTAISLRVRRIASR